MQPDPLDTAVEGHHIHHRRRVLQIESSGGAVFHPHRAQVAHRLRQMKTQLRACGLALSAAQVNTLWKAVVVDALSDAEQTLALEWLAAAWGCRRSGPTAFSSTPTAPFSASRLLP